jgi:hypothetical protein
MKNQLKIICLTLLLCLSAVTIYAEEIHSSDIADLINYLDTPVRIETGQGGNFQGILRAVKDDWVEVVDRDGLILFIDIQSIETYIVFDQTVTKDTFFQDSASNRLIVMPTGFPMEPGEFHVADQEIAAVTMSYGLSEHISFWSGISIPGFLMNARYTASFTPTFAVSFGSFAGLSWIGNEDGSHTAGIIPYCIASWGEPNNNITVGGGPLIVYDLGSNQSPELPGVIGVFGGKKVITATTSLIFENWIIWGERTKYGSMEPVANWYEVEDDSWGEGYWDFVPSMIFPAVCFRIASQRLSWDIGAVLPLQIANEEEVIIEADNDEEVQGYYKNTKYRLEGFGGEVILPIPILSITYRID